MKCQRTKHLTNDTSILCPLVVLRLITTVIRQSHCYSKRFSSKYLTTKSFWMLFEYEKENLLNTAKYADQILLCFEFSYELPRIWGIPLN